MNSDYSGGARAGNRAYKEEPGDEKPARATRGGSTSGAGASAPTNGPAADDDDDDDGARGGRERRKIEIKFIQDKGRRHITFSKRKHGIMKKAWELSILTGTQVLLLVVSETGLVYTYSTPKLQPLVTQAEGKKLIQDCLNAPDIPARDDDASYKSPAQSSDASVPEATGTGAPPAGAAAAAQAQPGRPMMPQSPLAPAAQAAQAAHMPAGAMRQPPPGQYMPAGLEPGIMLPPDQLAQMQEGYIPSEYGYIQGQPQARYPM